jgi:transcriptional regulator with XRE-family HTH domain
MTLAESIKNIRLTLGLSQSEFAHKINKDNTSVCLYEAGKRKPGFPTIRKIVELANANGMNLKYTDLRDE